MNSKTLSILVAAALCAAATSAIADSTVSDRHAAIGQLDATAGELTQSLSEGPRVGALERHDARRQLTSVEAERDRLAAGGPVDGERLATLSGDDMGSNVAGRDEIAQSLDDRHTVVERRTRRVGPRLGAIERTELREELADLDSLIADLEQGREVDLERVDALIGLMVIHEPTTLADQREELEIKRASDVRRLHSKVGAVERMRIHDEIDDIDRTIGRLDAQI